MNNQAKENITDLAVKLWARSGKHCYISACGRSMQPLIYAGDRIMVDHGSKSYRCGDILAFRRNGILIAHRIIFSQTRKGSLYYMTMGDTSDRFDPPVEPCQILGKAIAVAKKDGVIALNGPRWSMIGKCIAAICLLQEFIRRIFLKLPVQASARQLHEFPFSQAAKIKTTIMRMMIVNTTISRK